MTMPLARALSQVIREVFENEPPTSEDEHEVLALASKIETHITIAEAKTTARRERFESERNHE